MQSNDDLTVNAGAKLVAAVARAGGLAKGNITPAGESSAPAIADPFSDYDLTIPGTCPTNSGP